MHVAQARRIRDKKFPSSPPRSPLFTLCRERLKRREDPSRTSKAGRSLENRGRFAAGMTKEKGIDVSFRAGEMKTESRPCYGGVGINSSRLAFQKRVATVPVTSRKKRTHCRGIPSVSP